MEKKYTKKLNPNFVRLSMAYKDLNAPLHAREAARIITIAFPTYSVFWGEKPFGEKYIEWSNGTDHSITLDF